MGGVTSSPELVAMMLADGRLPVGGHTQSSGLEPAVRAGLGNEGRQIGDVLDYARDRLRTVVRVEAATAVVARHQTLKGGDLVHVDREWSARTPSQVLRAASRRQGRSYMRLAQRVWPSVLVHLGGDTEVPRPIVIGVVAAVTGLGAHQTAQLVGYDDAQTVVAASMKLLPVDPVEASIWLHQLHPDITRLTECVCDLTKPQHIAADGAPLVDHFAQQHATERMRLFHA